MREKKTHHCRHGRNVLPHSFSCAVSVVLVTFDISFSPPFLVSISSSHPQSKATDRHGLSSNQLTDLLTIYLPQRKKNAVPRLSSRSVASCAFARLLTPLPNIHICLCTHLFDKTIDSSRQFIALVRNVGFVCRRTPPRSVRPPRRYRRRSMTCPCATTVKQA